MWSPIAAGVTFLSRAYARSVFPSRHNASTNAISKAEHSLLVRYFEISAATRLRSSGNMLRAQSAPGG